MPVGPGKYDDLCTEVREQTEAEGVAIIVINGKHGSGFSVQAAEYITLGLPDLLEHMAKDIRASFAAGNLPDEKGWSS